MDRCVQTGESKETKDETVSAMSHSLSAPPALHVCYASASVLRKNAGRSAAARDPSFLGERRAVTCRYFVGCLLDRSTSLQITKHFIQWIRSRIISIFISIFTKMIIINLWKLKFLLICRGKFFETVTERQFLAGIAHTRTFSFNNGFPISGLQMENMFFAYYAPHILARRRSNFSQGNSLCGGEVVNQQSSLYPNSTFPLP